MNSCKKRIKTIIKRKSKANFQQKESELKMNYWKHQNKRDNFSANHKKNKLLMVYKVAKTQSFQSISVMKMRIIKLKIQVYFVLRET